MRCMACIDLLKQTLHLVCLISLVEPDAHHL